MIPEADAEANNARILWWKQTTERHALVTVVVFFSPVLYSRSALGFAETKTNYQLQSRTSSLNDGTTGRNLEDVRRHGFHSVGFGPVLQK